MDAEKLKSIPKIEVGQDWVVPQNLQPSKRTPPVETSRSQCVSGNDRPPETTTDQTYWAKMRIGSGICLSMTFTI